ncbi:MAG: cyclophilin-like fold protein [Candidatus Tectomicrobia bacterium]|nr:cyclophilin-like fold protein [Candidatus Tectomicrobia bacterium]
MTRIAIRIGSLTMEAELNDTHAAHQVADALPIRTHFSTWGDEIYFAIPIEAELEADAREVVEMGDLGYWPPGNAFCIFFGPTPMSQPGEIRPASAVNLIGKVIGDATQFKSVMQEREVILEAV